MVGNWADANWAGANLAGDSLLREGGRQEDVLRADGCQGVVLPAGDLPQGASTDVPRQACWPPADQYQVAWGLVRYQRWVGSDALPVWRPLPQVLLVFEPQQAFGLMMARTDADVPGPALTHLVGSGRRLDVNESREKNRHLFRHREQRLAQLTGKASEYSQVTCQSRAQRRGTPEKTVSCPVPHSFAVVGKISSF